MSRYLHQLSVSISLLFAVTTGISGQRLYPYEENEVMRCNVMIEMRHGYISGICAMQHRNDSVVGSVFNEFGVSAIDFSYDAKGDKVALTYIIGMLNKRLVKRTIRGDIKEWLHALQQGNNTYANTRRGITYTLMPLGDNEISEDETER